MQKTDFKNFTTKKIKYSNTWRGSNISKKSEINNAAIFLSKTYKTYVTYLVKEIFTFSSISKNIFSTLSIEKFILFLFFLFKQRPSKNVERLRDFGIFII